MADDPDTPVKMKVEIYKYCLDRALGKPRIMGEIGVDVKGDSLSDMRAEIRTALLEYQRRGAGTRTANQEGAS